MCTANYHTDEPQRDRVVFMYVPAGSARDTVVEERVGRTEKIVMPAGLCLPVDTG